MRKPSLAPGLAGGSLGQARHCLGLVALPLWQRLLAGMPAPASGLAGRAWNQALPLGWDLASDLADDLSGKDASPCRWPCRWSERHASVEGLAGDSLRSLSFLYLIPCLAPCLPCLVLAFWQRPDGINGKRLSMPYGRAGWGGLCRWACGREGSFSREMRRNSQSMLESSIRCFLPKMDFSQKGSKTVHLAVDDIPRSQYYWMNVNASLKASAGLASSPLGCPGFTPSPSSPLHFRATSVAIVGRSSARQAQLPVERCSDSG